MANATAARISPPEGTALLPAEDQHRGTGIGPSNKPDRAERGLRLLARRGIRARRGITGIAAVAAIFNVVASALAWHAGAQPFWLHVLVTVPTLYFVCICIHDCCHFMLTPKRWLTDTIGFFLSMLLGIPFPLLRASHLSHHRLFGTPDDPEAVVYNAKWYQLPVRLFWVPVYYCREWPNLKRVEQVVCVVHMSLVASALLLGGSLVWVGFVVPAFIAIAWFGATTVYAPHSPHAGKWMRALTGHSGYHYEHHRNVAVPYNQYWELRLRDLRVGLSVPNYAFEEAMLDVLNRPLSRLFDPGAAPGPRRTGAPSPAAPAHATPAQATPRMPEDRDDRAAHAA